MLGKKGGYLIPLTEILISLTLISSHEEGAGTFSPPGSLASHWQHCFSHTYWLADRQYISDRELMVGHSRSLQPETKELTSLATTGLLSAWVKGSRLAIEAIERRSLSGGVNDHQRESS